MEQHSINSSENEEEENLNDFSFRHSEDGNRDIPFFGSRSGLSSREI